MYRCLLWYDNIWVRHNYLNIWNLRVQIIENVVLKFFQIKFLGMYITNKKIRFDILTVWNWQNIFMEHDLQLMS